MEKINIKMVLLGGLIAGLVLNIGEFVLNGLVIGDAWMEWAKSMNLPEMGGNVIIFYVIWSFLVGIALVWLHAAIRPSFGANIRTAVIAGLFIWVTMWVLGFGSMLIQGVFPNDLIITSIVWGLFEVPLASVAGAYLYKE